MPSPTGSAGTKTPSATLPLTLNVYSISYSAPVLSHSSVALTPRARRSADWISAEV